MKSSARRGQKSTSGHRAGMGDNDVLCNFNFYLTFLCAFVHDLDLFRDVFVGDEVTR
jgi:hypothetical protein